LNPTHNYSVFKNSTSESGARYRRTAASGSCSLASARSFIHELAQQGVDVATALVPDCRYGHGHGSVGCVFVAQLAGTQFWRSKRFMHPDSRIVLDARLQWQARPNPTCGPVAAASPALPATDLRANPARHREKAMPRSGPNSVAAIVAASVNPSKRQEADSRPAGISSRQGEARTAANGCAATRQADLACRVAGSRAEIRSLSVRRSPRHRPRRCQGA
jgi:hypothetical protein